MATKMPGVTESAVIAVVKPGCPACDTAKPALAKAAKRVRGFVRVNADKNPGAVEDLQVAAFPDVVYKNSAGKVHHMPWKGTPNPTDIVEWVDQVRAGTAGTAGAGAAARPAKRPGTCAQCGKDGHGVAPSVWGPPVWFTIHMVALMYPVRPTPAQRRETLDFFRGLQKVLPCDYCKKHFAKELSTIDRAVFASRDALFAWTVAFHDKVSARTKSTQPRQSVDYWRAYYKRAAMRAMQQ